MRISRVFWLSVSALAMFASTPSFAAKFANQFTEFELPPQWTCQLEGAEWVCQSTDPKKKRDAIIVLAAKIKGDQDSLDQYLAYLNAPKTYKSVEGKYVKSEVKYAKIRNINGQPWVDALHLESEIPGFYTRYLATVKQDIGVLVTYSINKAKYQDYLEDFETMVRTLKVFRNPGAVNLQPQNSKLFNDTTIPANISANTVFPGIQPVGGSTRAVAQPKKGDNTNLLIILGVAVVGFLIWKKRRGAS